MLYRAFLLALLAGSSTAATVNNRRKLSYVPILNYSPGSQVDDHARIDLDQAMIEKALKTPIDWTLAGQVYADGVFSKPAAECTIDASSSTADVTLSKGDKVYFQTVGTAWATGKADKSYTAATKFTFAYGVAEAQIVPGTTLEYTDGTENCWQGDTVTGIAGSSVSGWLDNKGCAKRDAGSTPVNLIKLYVAKSGVTATNCVTGMSGGASTCETTVGSGVSTVDEVLATCVFRGKRSLKGFSTAAKKKMYDPLLTSPDCPTAGTTTGAVGKNGELSTGTKSYKFGCPYTSYKPYWDYYCSDAGSDCNGDGDYANQIISAALTGTKTTLNSKVYDLTAATGADPMRVELIKKGTAYLSAWMYAIREFEDAIDDCVSGTPSNGASNGPVHAWDEGVAFFVGSIMRPTADMFSAPTGKLAYTLGNKRCQDFGTCGMNGDSTAELEAKANSDLMALFTEGQQHLVTGNCADAVPVKDVIVQKMTIPLVQGTLKYANKLATTTPATTKELGEGVIFAAGVLPQLHACDPAAATTVYNNLNPTATTTDFAAVEKAFQDCYPKMFPDIPDPCKEIGGYVGKFAACPSPVAATSSALGGGAIAGIAIGAGLAVIFLLCLLVVICKEKSGKPVFVPTAGGAKA